MLYVVGTPIGNIKDITLRALEVLEEVDLILAEDTRQTVKLLNKYEIKTKLKSYHKHNENNLNNKVITMLKEGESIALVSDAGMPLISDPGQELVKKCIEEGVEVTTVPAATAFVSALILSGFKADEFTFLAFLPSKNKDRKQAYETIKNETRTVVFYEAPHRIKKTILDLGQCISPNRKIALIREITKLHEQALVKNSKEWEDFFKTNELKGEMVVVVEASDEQKEQGGFELSCLIPLESHIDYYMKKGHSKNESIKLVAKDRGLSRKEIYDLSIKD